MLVSKLREVLIGTGAEILQANAPVVNVWKDRFALVTPEEEAAVLDAVDWSTPRQPPFKQAWMTTGMSKPGAGEKYVRDILGGKKVIAYDAPDDYRDAQGEVVAFKLRYFIWTPE